MLWVSVAAGSRSLIAKSSSDGVLLEFWAHNRIVKVGGQGLSGWMNELRVVCSHPRKV
jgi:hypothetical protein